MTTKEKVLAAKQEYDSLVETYIIEGGWEQHPETHHRWPGLWWKRGVSMSAGVAEAFNWTSLEEAAKIATQYRFQVGNTYTTLEGKEVKVVARVDELKGYECVLGDDGAHRYDRSTSDSDAGRCTGTDHNFTHPQNFRRYWEC
jgi:hypothetical protein